MKKLIFFLGILLSLNLFHAANTSKITIEEVNKPSKKQSRVSFNIENEKNEENAASDTLNIDIDIENNDIPVPKSWFSSLKEKITYLSPSKGQFLYIGVNTLNAALQYGAYSLLTPLTFELDQGEDLEDVKFFRNIMYASTILSLGKAASHFILHRKYTGTASEVVEMVGGILTSVSGMTIIELQGIKKTSAAPFLAALTMFTPVAGFFGGLFLDDKKYDVSKIFLLSRFL